MSRNRPTEFGDSRSADKFVLRLTEGMRELIKARSISEKKAMNSVLVDIIDEALLGKTTTWLPTAGQSGTLGADPTLWTVVGAHGTRTSPRLWLKDLSGRYGDRKDVALSDFDPLFLNV